MANVLPVDFPNTKHVVSGGGRSKPGTRLSDEERAAFQNAWLDDNLSIDEVADLFEIGKQACYLRAKSMGLPTRRKKAKKSRKARNPSSDSSGQRRFTGVDPDSTRHVHLDPWHPAVRNGSTIYGKMVIPALLEERMLKSGEHNRKIGRELEKGRWAGMPILTLTLEERATCPRTCRTWDTCYGNNMGKAPRILDDGWLMPKLRIECHRYAALHPDGFIVRLHVLGDFYSTEYVQFWRQMLTEVPQLHIFGFTGWQPDTDIGRAVLALMEDDLDRVAIRVSGGGHKYSCSEVVETKEQANFAVCPAELDADKCCASCGFCMAGERSISFLQHG